MSLRFSLRDTNGAVVESWRQHFANHTDVTVSEGDIFDQPADAIVGQKLAPKDLMDACGHQFEMVGRETRR